MNTIRLNTIGEVVAKKTSGGGPTGGGATINDGDAAIFYDYDGTILYSFSKETFLAMREFPPLPTREGLICQEWNWDFTEAQEYVSKYGVLTIGATYITDDGKTRLYVTVPKGQSLNLSLTGDLGMDYWIDWGNGVTNVLTNTYEEEGDYCITIEVADGVNLVLGTASSTNGILGSSKSAASCLTKVELGRGFNLSGQRAFLYCVGLQTITIPKEAAGSIGSYSFSECYSLKAVIFPNGITSAMRNLFNDCYALTALSYPATVTQMDFPSECPVEAICVPPGCKMYLTTSNTTSNISKFTKYVIFPDDTIYGEGANYYGYSNALRKIIIRKSSTTIAPGALRSCYALQEVRLPSAITTLPNNTFENCYALRRINLPQGLLTIGEKAFYCCYSLQKLNFPNTITSIGAYAFTDCGLLTEFDFSQFEAIPTLSATNAFSTSTESKIIVPDALYDEWIAATNWSTYADRIIKKSDWDASQS